MKRQKISASMPTFSSNSTHHAEVDTLRLGDCGPRWVMSSTGEGVFAPSPVSFPKSAPPKYVEHPAARGIAS